jgi:hypothetical protein
MKRKHLLLISILAISLSACGAGYEISDSEYRAVATNAALGTAPPPYYQTQAAIYMVPTQTPTPGEERTFVDTAATAVYDKMAADATAQAMELALLQQQSAMTATAISIQTTATYQAEMAANATAGAREAATASAAAQFATATNQAYLIQATASKEAWQVQATATERSWQATATVDAELHTAEMLAMATQQAADAIRLEGESAQINLAVERQQIKNKADAILPWTLVIAALIIAGALAYHGSKFRMAKRNPDGTFNLPMFQDEDGGWTILRPELLPQPGATVRKNGVIDYHPTDDREEQSETTRRAQGADALRALPPGRENQALQIMGSAFETNAPGGMPDIEILPPESTSRIGSVLDELEGQVLDE